MAGLNCIFMRFIFLYKYFPFQLLKYILLISQEMSRKWPLRPHNLIS